MHHRSADHRPRRVEFGRQAAHPERPGKSPGDQVAHRVAPFGGVAAVGQRAGDDVGENDAGRARVSELFVGPGDRRLAFGEGGHVGSMRTEQHRDGIGIPRRIGGFDMIDARRHVEQMAHGDAAARIARPLPVWNRRRIIERQPPVGDEKADQHRRDAFRHRPADQAAVRGETGTIGLVHRHAIAQDQQRAGLTHRGAIAEQRVDPPGDGRVAARSRSGRAGCRAAPAAARRCTRRSAAAAPSHLPAPDDCASWPHA